MGSISFLLPDPVPPAAIPLLANATFAAGYDMAPVPGNVSIQDNRLTITRNLDESGYLLVPWPVGQFGTVVSASSTLREATTSYRLLLELARGKLNQVRTHTAEWEAIGLRLPPEYDAELRDVTQLFARSLLCQTTQESDTLATRVLERSYALADSLTREYVSQLFDTRHQEEGLLDTRLATRSRSGPGELAAEYARTFNASQISFCWRDLEPEEARYNWSAPDLAVAAAKSTELPITGGPIIDLATGMVPVWAEQWNGDLPTLAAFMCEFVEETIGRYKEDIRRWVVCAGFNQADSLGLDDDERLRLAFRLFEAASQVDPELELVLSVAQPWGDYLIHENHTISPLTFPDDMIRAGVRVSAVELELRIGSVPRGSLPRDLLDTARLLNLYGLLGVPLEIVLGLPSGSPKTPLGNTHGQTIWTSGWPSSPTSEGQAEWGASFAALVLSAPHVRSVTWDNWTDAESQLTPWGGLLDAAGNPKPLLSRLRTLRTAHLR